MPGVYQRLSKFISAYLSPELQTYIFTSLLNISTWISKKYLKLSMFRTEFLIFLPKHPIRSLPHLTTRQPILALDQPKTLDESSSNLSFLHHTSNPSSESTWFYLLTISSATTLVVQSAIGSCLDYYSSLLTSLLASQSLYIYSVPSTQQPQ